MRCFWVIALILIACSNPSDINKIKESTMLDYQTTTIGKAFDSMFDNQKWSAFEGFKGERVVQFTGTISNVLHQCVIDIYKAELNQHNEKSAIYAKLKLFHEIVVEFGGVNNEYFQELNERYDCNLGRKIAWSSEGTGYVTYPNCTNEEMDSMYIENVIQWYFNQLWKIGEPINVQWIIFTDGSSFELTNMVSKAWGKWRQDDVLSVIYECEPSTEQQEKIDNQITDSNLRKKIEELLSINDYKDIDVEVLNKIVVLRGTVENQKGIDDILKLILPIEEIDQIKNFLEIEQTSENQKVVKTNENNITNFVKNFIDAQNSRDVSRLLDFYGENVDYYSEGIINKSFISRDKKSFYKRWPIVKYKIIGDVIENEVNEEKDMKDLIFITDFDVSNPNNGSRVMGKAENNITIKLIGVNKKIEHKVNSGESIYTIARKYGSSVTNIRKENNLTSLRIKVNQILKITVKEYNEFKVVKENQKILEKINKKN